MTSQTQGLQEEDSSSVKGSRPIQRSGDRTMKIRTNSVQYVARTNPNRVTVRDADNKGLYMLDVYRETAQKCSEIFRHEMF